MSEIKPIVGICMDFCPKDEIKWREENGLLHEFEISKGSEVICDKENSRGIKIQKADKRKVIKEFSRSSAGQRMQTPQELRPPKVLAKVVDYLLGNISKITSVPWNIVYDFIFNRLRAVRQDMSIQCSHDEQCMTILEAAVRFHIYSSYKFDNKIDRLFDPHINDIHLRECLQSLLKRYDSSSSIDCSKYRPIFESIYLIYNLGSNDALLRYGTLPYKVQNHYLIKKCFKIGLDFEKGLYYQVINSMMALKPTILALMSSTKLPKLHFMAIQRMSFGYNSLHIKFPISAVTKWLCSFESDSNKANKYIIHLCKSCGLNVDNEYVIFSKTKFNEKAKPPSLEKWSSIDVLLSESSLSSLLRGRKECAFVIPVITLD